LKPGRRFVPLLLDAECLLQDAPFLLGLPNLTGMKGEKLGQRDPLPGARQKPTYTNPPKTEIVSAANLSSFA
jgi:hypothetical protein